MTHDPQAVLDAANRVAREEPDARGAYLATLRDIAAGEAPPDASVRLAKARKQLCETGRIVSEQDQSAHLDVFLKIHERQTTLENARARLEELRTVDEIEQDIIRLDHVIAAKVAEMPEFQVKRDLIAERGPTRRASHDVEQAEQLLAHAKREASDLHYKLRAKDVRVDPRRR